MWDRATHLEVPGVPAVQYSWPESVHGRAHLPHCPRKASVSERFTGPSGDDHLMNSCPKSQLFSSKEKKTTPFLFSDDLFAVANPLLRVCVCVCVLLIEMRLPSLGQVLSCIRTGALQAQSRSGGQCRAQCRKTSFLAQSHIVRQPKCQPPGQASCRPTTALSSLPVPLSWRAPFSHGPAFPCTRPAQGR